MIIINGTANTLEAVMAAGATTTQPSFFVSYVSINNNTLTTSANTSGSLTGTTPVAMLVGNATNQYKVDQIDIYNLDTVNQTVTVSVLVSATNINLYTAILQPN